MEPDTIASAFQSERLIFQSVDADDKEIRHFLHTQMNDPENLALGQLNVIRPAAPSRAEWLLEQLKKADLGVIIYIRSHQVLKEDIPRTTPIGHLVINWGGQALDQAHHRTAQFGISLATPYLDQGFGSEAINWGLDWAFRRGGFHRVSLGTPSYNKRAMRVYEKLGFVEEGRRREATWYDRQWYDMVLYGMLESEWESLRALN